VATVSSLPSLNNNGDQLTLKTPTGTVSDFVAYDNSWYNDAIKQDGGWTLERINPFNTCDASKNWSASNDNLGGTPGSENSIFDDAFFDRSQIEVLSVFYTDEESLDILFSKTPAQDQFLSGNVFNISPAISIQSISISEIDPRTVRIDFQGELIQNIIYDLAINNLRDCGDFSSVTDNFVFGQTSQPLPQDLLITEILFNPATGGVDFIEIVNVTDKLFGFDGLVVLELDVFSNEVVDFVRLEETRQYILPNKYYVLTSNNETILEQYEVENPGHLIEVAIPNYADEEGKIAMLNEVTDSLDVLRYSKDWHAPTLNRVDGVSLERISLEEPTQQESNWLSASFLRGNATPTSENSQRGSTTTPQGDQLVLSGEIFTPDGDGFDDSLLIEFTGINEAATATIRIYNARGFIVKTLVNNQLVGVENEIRWLGENENNQQVPIGHYFIVAELFDANGDKQILKNKVVVSRRF